jgi:hypothetical protein
VLRHRSGCLIRCTAKNTPRSASNTKQTLASGAEFRMHPRASELSHTTGCALSDGRDKSSVVLDRESDQEKSLNPSGPRITISALRLVAAQGRPRLVSAASGTRLTRGSWRHATNGVQPSAFLVLAWRPGRWHWTLSRSPASASSATNPVLLPEAKPRAIRQHFVVSSKPARSKVAHLLPQTRADKGATVKVCRFDPLSTSYRSLEIQEHMNNERVRNGQ